MLVKFVAKLHYLGRLNRYLSALYIYEFYHMDVTIRYYKTSFTISQNIYCTRFDHWLFDEAMEYKYFHNLMYSKFSVS